MLDRNDSAKLISSLIPELIFPQEGFLPCQTATYQLWVENEVLSFNYNLSRLSYQKTHTQSMCRTNDNRKQTNTTY